MKEGSLEITYYPRGFKKQKHGKDVLHSGVVIGRGRPEPTLKKAVKILLAVDKQIDDLDKAAEKRIRKLLE